MLILILGLLVIAFVACIRLYRKRKTEIREVYIVMAVITSIAMLGSIVGICILTTEVATESVLDNRIAMYQEENDIIEKDIDRIVDAYLKHEQDTFLELKTEDNAITLVTLFPELKSDTLVQQQLEIYVDNNAMIKSLKEDKINLAKIKWILYFGK